MRKPLLIVALGAFAAGAAGCSVVDDVSGIARSLSKPKNDPETARRNDLERPPGFATRPRPGADARARADRSKAGGYVLDDGTKRDSAGRPIKPGAHTSVEEEVLRKAGLKRSTSAVVRRTVDIESTQNKDDERKFADRLMRFDPNRRRGKAPRGGRDATREPPIIR
jgi:hypothetical protein